MTPRKDSLYKKLPSDLKPLYLMGMPPQYIEEVPLEFSFRNERMGAKILSSSVQKKAFETFKTILPGDSRNVIITSTPTDHEALQCACQMVREHQKSSGFHDVSFVSPYSHPPYKEEDRKRLYVLIGLNSNDPMIGNHIRRWFRSTLGVSVWALLASDNPIDFIEKGLGVYPDFLFCLRRAGVVVG